MHIEEILPGDEFNIQLIELPITFDFRERISETELFTFIQYIKDVGSFLAIAAFTVYIIFTPINMYIVYQFVTSIMRMIQRKYKDNLYINKIENMQKKFAMIYGALEERADEPAFKEYIDKLGKYKDIGK